MSKTTVKPGNTHYDEGGRMPSTTGNPGGDKSREQSTCRFRYNKGRQEMKKLSFAVLSVFCLAGLIVFTSCKLEIPADEPIEKAVTFTIYNKADCDLTIESIGFDSYLSIPYYTPIGWDDSSIITGNVENVNKTIPANSSEVIRLIVKGYKRYEESNGGYTSSDEYPLYCIIDCHYGDNSSSYPYTGYALDSSSDADYTKNSYMTASAAYRFVDTNTFHFVKTTDGDYVLATVN